MTSRDLKPREPAEMHPVAKGLWSLIVLVLVLLALAFLVPLLLRLLIWLPQQGWQVVS